MLNDLIIIGGGAAGLVCAIEAARLGVQVTVLERLDRVGKKLLAAGNGRCNLMNTDEPRYLCGSSFAVKILKVWDAQAQCEFWQSLGLRLREEADGRVYPASGAASTVLDVLRTALQLQKIRIVTDCEVQLVVREKHGFSVLTDKGNYQASKVMIAGGGCAQPKLGSNGSAAVIAEKLGHHVIPFSPVLTALECDVQPIAGLSGIRIRADVSVVNKGKHVHTEPGEVLFTDYGLSGVCIMNCSGYLQPGDLVELNLLRAFGLPDRKTLDDELRTRLRAFGGLTAERFLTGLCVPRLALSVLKAAGIKKDTPVAALGSKLNGLEAVICSFPVKVKALRGFEQAQVSRGGVDTNEVDPATMASRIVSGCYLGGQVMNVDGECGGFNLMFAVACGLTAAHAMEDR